MEMKSRHESTNKVRFSQCEVLFLGNEFRQTTAPNNQYSIYITSDISGPGD